MTKTKQSLNQADINLLKKTFPTINDEKEIVNKIVIDTSHTILAGVQTMFDDHNQENNKNFERLETKVDNVEKHLKGDIDGLKAEFSLQVSKKEFNQLKDKVEKFHPTN